MKNLKIENYKENMAFTHYSYSIAEKEKNET